MCIIGVNDKDNIPFPTFYRQNKDTNQRWWRLQICFCGSPEESRFKMSQPWGDLISLLNFSLQARCFSCTSMLFTVTFTRFLNSWKAWRTSCLISVVFWTSLVRRDARLEYRLTSATVVQTVHLESLETQMSLLVISQSLNERHNRSDFIWMRLFIEVIEYASLTSNVTIFVNVFGSCTNELIIWNLNLLVVSRMQSWIDYSNIELARSIQEYG